PAAGWRERAAPPPGADVQAPPLESDTARSLALDHRPRRKERPWHTRPAWIVSGLKSRRPSPAPSDQPSWADRCASGSESPGGGGSGPASRWLAPRAPWSLYPQLE